MFFNSGSAWSKRLPLAISIACSLGLSECQAGYNPLAGAQKALSKATQQAGKSVSQAGKQVQKSASSASTQVRRTTSSAGKQATTAASSAARKVGTMAKSAAAKAGITATKTAKQVSGSVSRNAQQTSRTVTSQAQQAAKKLTQSGTSSLNKLRQSATSGLKTAGQKTTSQVRQVGSQFSNLTKQAPTSATLTKSLPRSVPSNNRLKSLTPLTRSLTTGNVTRSVQQSLGSGPSTLRKLPGSPIKPSLKTLEQILPSVPTGPSLKSITDIRPPASVSGQPQVSGLLDGNSLKTSPRYPVPRISNRDVSREAEVGAKVAGNVATTLFQGFFGGGSRGAGGGRSGTSGTRDDGFQSTVDGDQPGKGKAEQTQPKDVKEAPDEENDPADKPVQVTGGSLRGE